MSGHLELCCAGWVSTSARAPLGKNGFDSTAPIQLGENQLCLGEDLGNLIWLRVIKEIAAVPTTHLCSVAFVGVGRGRNGYHHCSRGTTAVQNGCRGREHAKLRIE